MSSSHHVSWDHHLAIKMVFSLGGILCNHVFRHTGIILSCNNILYIVILLYHVIYNGWWFQTLKNMKVSWDDYSQYIWKNKIHVPNQQPVYIYIVIVI